MGWNASQADMLADDWAIVGLANPLPPIDESGQAVPEIKTVLHPLVAGVPYTPNKHGEYVITDSHSISDVIRFCISQLGGGKQAREELMFLTAKTPYGQER